MIVNPEGSLVLSSLGWVEGDAAWVLDVGRGERFELSVSSFADPSVSQARAVVARVEARFIGDPALWQDLPFLLVEYLAFQPWDDFALITVTPSAGRVAVPRLEWYDDSCDKGYQGVTGAHPVPDEKFALITVQRSSRLVLHNLMTGRAERFVDLADRGVQEFIGDFTFTMDARCVVARPFSGDVVELDDTLKVKRRAKLGRQPLEAVGLSGGAVVARDWKAGDLLKGTLARTWFAG